jgi:hypothetical protein
LPPKLLSPSRKLTGQNRIDLKEVTAFLKKIIIKTVLRRLQLQSALPG